MTKDQFVVEFETEQILYNYCYMVTKSPHMEVVVFLVVAAA